MNILYTKESSHSLLKFENALLLRVLCGTTSMYELCLPLSEDDASQAIDVHGKIDENFVDNLASIVRDNPSLHADTHVELPM